jgi:cytochrome P450
MPTSFHAPRLLSSWYGHLAALREEDPAHWSEDDQVWLLTRHEDVKWLSRHFELFSSENERRAKAPQHPPLPPDEVVCAEFVSEFRTHEFIQNDPPAHPRMRRVHSAQWTRKRVEEWRPRVRDLVAKLIDEAERSGGQVDVVADLAAPLPLLVISEMLGIPEEDRALVKAQADRRMASAITVEPDRMSKAAAGIQASNTYLDARLEERLREPRDDMLTLFAEAEKQGLYTRQESLANAQMLIDAGHHTTVQLIANGVLALLRHPDQWRDLTSDPYGLAETATEECLRWEPSVLFLRRVATRDVELHDKTMHQGDRVFGVVPAANRDPRVFVDPERFDIRRSPNEHLTFNVGLHACLGKHLARVEGQEVFAALASRFPRMHLVEQGMDWVPDRRRPTLKSLEVILEP